jgi:hypothetical protein
MRESERAVHEAADGGELRVRNVCRQLLGDRVRYFVWHAKHETRMESVALARRREPQLLELRRAGVEFVHRAAFVRHLKDHGLRGASRDRLLREFYGPLDSRAAAILEHRNYLSAASSQWCAATLLELADDHRGVEQLQLYETAYSQYFGLFCERIRAAANREAFLLKDLLPEVRDVAVRLRQRILSGHVRQRRTSAAVHAA